MSSLRKAVVNVLPQKYKTKLRNSIHPAQRANLARMFSKDLPDWGTLSVIIPVYNVAEYMADCLESVISQSYAKLEIIVVDDGSTDNSMEIAERFAKYDKRINIIRLENGGNGRARNIGIAAAKGDYLTFADSDDIVAPGAYLLMMSTLRRSGSDFVVGSYERLIGKKHERTKLSLRLHAESHTDIRIDEFPDILDDVFLWNKVFRRKFWEEKVSPIPEGVLYEDQESTARAFVRAQSFEVLKEVVYYWRQRTDGSSITQGKRGQKDLIDRLSVAHSVTALLTSEATQGVIRQWFVRLLGSDLVTYYDQVPYTEATYWSALREGVASLYDLVADSVHHVDSLMPLINPHARVLMLLAATGAKDEFEQVVIDRIETGTGFKIDIRDNQFYAIPNYWKRLKDYSAITELECDHSILDFDTQISVRGWSKNGDLRLRGHAFLRGFDEELSETVTTLSVEVSPGIWQKLHLEQIIDDDIDALTNDSFASHQASVFEVALPATVLAERDSGFYNVKISFDVSGHDFHATHSMQVPGKEPDPAKLVPLVIGFTIDRDAEEFCIDIRWGDRNINRELYLATQQNRIDPVRTIEFGEGKTRYTFRLAGTAWGRQICAPRSGSYTLRYSHKDAVANAQNGKAISVSQALAWKLPMTTQSAHANIQAWITTAGKLAVTIGAPLGIRERGKYRQRSLQQIHFENPRTLQNHVVFESFGGKSSTDSPRALSDVLYEKHPDSEIFWSIEDYSVNYPAYAKPLIRGSKKWFEKVATAKYLVNNNNFPFYFRKMPGQFYLQTWHGTPMKKIGLDAPTRYLSPSYRLLMEREATYWDALLAQNGFSSKVMPKAFGFSGAVLLEGYPRNDSLFAVDAAEVARSTREILGLREDQKAVLYAPTWRDKAKDSSGSHRWVGHIDFNRAHQIFDEQIIFLVRGHHNVLGGQGIGQGRNVIDVSSYPEINDLILASDALITDYSSIMFDYATTRKPMYFLVADLLEYESDVRGLYLSHNEVGLGDVFTSSEDVIDALRLIRPATAEQLRARATYTSQDDQFSSVRVNAAIFSLLGDNRESP